MSDFTKALAELNKTLDGMTPQAAPTSKDMTKAEAIAYVKEQVVKAEADEPELARKRLDHLRGVVESLAKVNFESTERTAVPLYQEPNLTALAEMTEKEIPPAGAEGKETQADQTFAASGGTQSFAKSEDGNQPKQTLFEGLLDSFDKILAGDGRAPASIDVTPPEDKSPRGFWPTDVNSPTFMAEGITKRAGDLDDWGNDPAPSAGK